MTTRGRLRPNPGYPTIWMKLRRPRVSGPGPLEETFHLTPVRFEYSSSTTEADILEVTVSDPGYTLINHPMLLEDLQTWVDFTFGYANDPDLMAPTQSLVFFRQRPSFSESGEVQTTLTFYDAGVYLSLPLAPRRYDDVASINDAVERVVNQVNDVYQLSPRLTVDFGGKVYPSKYWRLHRGTMSASQFLSYLRGAAREENLDEFIEIFVDGTTVAFRPARTKGYADVGYYHYHSGVFGDDLLSFEPEVENRIQEVQMRGIDQESGRVVNSPTANTTPDMRSRSQFGPNVLQAGPTRVNFTTITGGDAAGANRAAGKEPVAKVSIQPTPANRADKPKVQEGIPVPKVLRVEAHVISPNTVTLEAIADRYENTSVQAIATENGLDVNDYELRIGQSIRVPILEQTDQVETAESVAASRQVFLEEERRMLRATATVVGDPALKAGWPAQFRNVGNRWEGRWYIEKADHRLDEGGYKTTLTLIKGAIPVIGEGIDTEASSADNIDAVTTEQRTADEQAAATAEAAKVAAAQAAAAPTPTTRVTFSAIDGN